MKIQYPTTDPLTIEPLTIEPWNSFSHIKKLRDFPAIIMSSRIKTSCPYSIYPTSVTLKGMQTTEYLGAPLRASWLTRIREDYKHENHSPALYQDFFIVSTRGWLVLLLRNGNGPTFSFWLACCQFHKCGLRQHHGWNKQKSFGDFAEQRSYKCDDLQRENYQQRSSIQH